MANNEMNYWCDASGEVINFELDEKRFALDGITQFEALLRKHAEFEQYLDQQNAQ